MESIIVSLISVIVCTIILSIIIWVMLAVLIVVIRRRKPNSLKVFGISVLISAGILWSPMLISIFMSMLNSMDISAGDVIGSIGNAFRNFSISDAIDRISGFIALGLGIIAVVVLITLKRRKEK